MEIDVSRVELFKENHQEWIFMEREKLGLKKKLAHRWYGHFRVKQQTEKLRTNWNYPTTWLQILPKSSYDTIEESQGDEQTTTYQTDR